ncbi:hypothetical protein D3C86_1128510 [compost metagenome]
MVILNFPSLYAPAPPNPFVIEHAGKHPAKLFLFVSGGHLEILPSNIGHLRLKISSPLSTANILRFGFFKFISYAANIPAGPKPTIITS